MQPRTFNGTTTQYVHQAGGSFTPSETFSLEVWVKSTVGGRIAALASQQSGNNVLGVTYRSLFMNANGTVSFTVSTGLLNASIVTTSTYGDGQWHHVVATMSTSGMRLYVDGIQRATGANASVVGTAGYWRVGADRIGLTPVSVNGSLDNFAVYLRALTPAQVAGHSASRS